MTTRGKLLTGKAFELATSREQIHESNCLGPLPFVFWLCGEQTRQKRQAAGRQDLPATQNDRSVFRELQKRHCLCVVL